jgi:pyruvate dehydrogenase E2 component (dihydrolipoamide acetyltransferase)
MAERVLMLALSPTMEKGAIVRWLKKEGDRVNSGDILCEVETDKATMEYESVQEGTLLKIVVPEGKEARVGELIAVIGKPGEDIQPVLGEAPPANAAEPVQPAAAVPPPAAPVAEAAKPPETPSGHVRTSPLARRLADEHGLDLRAIAGSGPGGRIVKRDIEQAVAAKSAAPMRAAGSEAPAPVRPGGTDVQEIPVSQKRKIIAQRLAESMYSAPHFYLTVPVDMGRLLEARERLNAGRGADKISLNAFLVKFSAEALKRHPMVNSSWAGETIRVHPSADIGLAVAQPDGLIAPVARDCGRKGIVEIDAELRALIERVKANRLTPEDYAGATFTISNLGSFGIEEFTAIINPPGSAILAVGEIRRQPVVGPGDALVIRPLMRMTLSCDHRVVDGAVGAAFLKDLKDMMEEPVRTLY